jgi:hypothetical protein
MNFLANVRAAALTAATLGVFGGVNSALAAVQPSVQSMAPQTSHLLAQTFGNVGINEANFLVVAAPGSVAQPYRLLIVEQVQTSRPCWNLVDANVRPTQVNDLWNTFDFTGVCRLQKDSNGFAVRLSGQDVAGARFEVNNRGGDLLLQFAPGTISRERITIGRTGGISPTGFTKIHLDPGWSLTKRTFNGQIVSSHLVYFTNDLTLAQLQGGQTGGEPDPGTSPPPVVTLPFNDIRGNRYANEIVRASQLALVSGFPDGTFKPTSPVTREQAVSIVMQAAGQILPTSLIAARPQSVTSPPFPDVPANRWSALKILQAKSLGIVSGDFGTGNFRPDSNVSRAELMAMLYKLALVDADAGAGDLGSTTPVPGQEQAATGIIPNIPNPPVFTDISGHWGENTIRQMAAFCAVATPLNETGANFAPNTNALRDYTAAAAVRLVDCPAARPQP